LIIDIHLHAVRKKSLPHESAGGNFATPEELIRIMNRTGVDKGVLLPNVNPEARTQYTTTEDVLEICQKYPRRFIPFCNIDPRAENNTPKADLSRQLSYYKKAGCKGVGEICANLYFDDPFTLNFFRHCEKTSMPVLFHIAPHAGGLYGLIDDLHLPRLEKCVKKFPKLIFIGHSQCFWSEISGDVTNKTRGEYPKGPVRSGGAVPKLLEKYKNIYADISAGSGLNALTRDPEFGYGFMEKFRDKLFFGTDICSPERVYPHAQYIRKALKEGKISRETFEKITWRNINKILKLGLRGAA